MLCRNLHTDRSNLHLVETLENCSRLGIDVPPSAFRSETLTVPNLIFDLEFQSQESYGHSPIHMQTVKVKGHSVQKLERKQSLSAVVCH